MEIFSTKTFEPKFNYSRLELQALKVCEEAHELAQAAKKLNVIDAFNDMESRRYDLVNEGADVIQSVLNLYGMMGMDAEDIEQAMYECYRRNVHRGRVE